MISLPPFRQALTTAYRDENRRTTVCRDVQAAMGGCDATCDLYPNGIFRLSTGGVSLVPNYDSHDVTIAIVPLTQAPTDDNPLPSRPDPRTDPSVPLAYWHGKGSQEQIDRLYAGARALALAVRS